MVMDIECIYDIASQYVALPGASLRRKRRLEAPEAYREGAEVMHGGGGRMTPGEGSIVVLTGAGISVESGLPSFRGAGGLWEGWRLEDVATPEAFARDPTTVQRFYDQRRRQLLGEDIHPNAAHLALAELERRWPGEILIVTQNIDDLHERAGTCNLIHMHGELLKARCTNCDSVHPWRSDLAISHDCASCAGENKLRPHVVWFGEMPLDLDRIYDALTTCDLFVAIGTSGQVYPAAGFVDAVRAAGQAQSIELNLELGGAGSRFAEQRHGRATEIVPAYVADLLSGPDG
jgi:NAD-dependent protein deacetylase/lipoamidase